MIGIIQRVSGSDVKVNGEIVGNIDKGILLFLGITKNDKKDDMDYLVRKVINMRIFEDEDGKMNKSLLDIDAELLVVSQFTLCANTKKGNRPGFDFAAKPEIAEKIYNEFIEECRKKGVRKVESGQFRKMMDVQLINKGPVTIIVDSNVK